MSGTQTFLICASLAFWDYFEILGQDLCKL